MSLAVKGSRGESTTYNAAKYAECNDDGRFRIFVVGGEVGRRITQLLEFVAVINKLTTPDLCLRVCLECERCDNALRNVNSKH